MLKSFYFPAALVCAAAALLFPSEALTWAHIGASGKLLGQLLSGGLYLKLALGALAVYLFVLGYAAHTMAPAIPIPEYAYAKGSRPTTEISLLVALLLVASILRLHALGAGLWYDEIMTYLYYGGLRIGEAMTSYDSQNQHFLYTLAWKLLLPWFRDDALALRLPAVAFGVASIAALYFFAVETVGRREALAASVLMTLSYHHVWFSQNARGYTALMFFAILSGHFLVRALRRPDPGPWMSYAIAVALGAYSQPTMVLVCAGQFVSFLLHGLRPNAGNLELVSP